MTIKKFKYKLKLTISAILAGLALYSASVMKSIEDENAYNRLPKNEKVIVDSLRKVGVEEDELKKNISLMSDVLIILQGVQSAIKNQKDWDKQTRVYFPDTFNFQRAQRIGSLMDEIALAFDKLNKMNPKIFDTREIRARLEQAKKELNEL